MLDSHDGCTDFQNPGGQGRRRPAKACSRIKSVLNLFILFQEWSGRVAWIGALLFVVSNLLNRNQQKSQKESVIFLNFNMKKLEIFIKQGNFFTALTKVNFAILGISLVINLRMNFCFQTSFTQSIYHWRIFEWLFASILPRIEIWRNKIWSGSIWRSDRFGSWSTWNWMWRDQGSTDIILPFWHSFTGPESRC